MAESTIPDERVLDVLRASAVFGSLDEAVLQDLRRLLVLQIVPGGHIVYREGDQANTMFFLISGRLRVSRRGPDGAIAALQRDPARRECRRSRPDPAATPRGRHHRLARLDRGHAQSQPISNACWCCIRCR